ncbi:MAG: hypothetical protein DLD55_00625 [candidate division SR1 bacterium]|nr:MAG: hypothetical protein DLD55_00625 [candidate division SR1 bacterium]
MSEAFTGIEDLGNVRSDVNQVTEEAVQRIQAQSKQAKQVAQQIKKDKAINTQLANFLTLLMRTIDNEELIQAMVATFFKTTNPKNQITYLRKDINTYVIVGFFVPFFPNEAESFHILGFYEQLGAKEAGSSLKLYLSYLGRISEVYHDNVPIDQDSLLNMIILIAQTRLFKGKSLPKSEEIRQEVLHALYGA